MGIGTAIGIGTGIAGTAVSGVEANKAANTQANAANQAAQLQAKSAADALAFEKQQYATQQANQAPWLASGTQALGQLQSMPSFQGPGADFTQDPGYQFRVAQGLKAIQNSAAARGGALSGGTLKGITDYSSGAASQEYNNAFNRSLSTYQTNQNALLSRAGLGQNATQQLGQAGTAAAGQVAGTTLTAGEQQAQDLQNAAAATASGYAATGNVAAEIPGQVNNTLLYSQIAKLLPQNGASGGNPYGALQTNPAYTGVDLTQLQPIQQAVV